VQARSHPAYDLQVSTVVAGLAALFIGSMLECFLLGSLTFPLFAMLLYLSLGNHLADTMPAEEPEVSQPQPRPPQDQNPSPQPKRLGPVKRSIAIR